jgi:hypothetical protein
MILCQILVISNLQKLMLYKPEIDKSGSTVNDPWPCTDDSAWEIRPTSAYTNMLLYCIVNSVAIIRVIFFERCYIESQNNLVYKYKILR